MASDGCGSFYSEISEHQKRKKSGGDEQSGTPTAAKK